MCGNWTGRTADLQNGMEELSGVLWKHAEYCAAHSPLTLAHASFRWGCRAQPGSREALGVVAEPSGAAAAACRAGEDACVASSATLAGETVAWVPLAEDWRSIQAAVLQWSASLISASSAFTEVAAIRALDFVIKTVSSRPQAFQELGMECQDALREALSVLVRNACAEPGEAAFASEFATRHQRPMRFGGSAPKAAASEGEDADHPWSSSMYEPEWLALELVGPSCIAMEEVHTLLASAVDTEQALDGRGSAHQAARLHIISRLSALDASLLELTLHLLRSAAAQGEAVPQGLHQQLLARLIARFSSSMCANMADPTSLKVLDAQSISPTMLRAAAILTLGPGEQEQPLILLERTLRVLQLEQRFEGDLAQEELEDHELDLQVHRLLLLQVALSVWTRNADAAGNLAASTVCAQRLSKIGAEMPSPEDTPGVLSKARKRLCPGSLFTLSGTEKGPRFAVGDEVSSLWSGGGNSSIFPGRVSAVKKEEDGFHFDIAYDDGDRDVGQVATNVFPRGAFDRTWASLPYLHGLVLEEAPGHPVDDVAQRLFRVALLGPPKVVGERSQLLVGFIREAALEPASMSTPFPDWLPSYLVRTPAGSLGFIKGRALPQQGAAPPGAVLVVHALAGGGQGGSSFEESTDAAALQSITSMSGALTAAVQGPQSATKSLHRTQAMADMATVLWESLKVDASVTLKELCASTTGSVHDSVPHAAAFVVFTTVLRALAATVAATAFANLPGRAHKACEFLNTAMQIDIKQGKVCPSARPDVDAAVATLAASECHALNCVRSFVQFLRPCTSQSPAACLAHGFLASQGWIHFGNWLRAAGHSAGGSVVSALDSILQQSAQPRHSMEALSSVYDLLSVSFRAAGRFLPDSALLVHGFAQSVQVVLVRRLKCLLPDFLPELSNCMTKLLTQDGRLADEQASMQVLKAVRLLVEVLTLRIGVPQGIGSAIPLLALAAQSGISVGALMGQANDSLDACIPEQLTHLPADEMKSALRHIALTLPDLCETTHLEPLLEAVRSAPLVHHAHKGSASARCTLLANPLMPTAALIWHDPGTLLLCAAWGQALQRTIRRQLLSALSASLTSVPDAIRIAAACSTLLHAALHQVPTLAFPNAPVCRSHATPLALAVLRQTTASQQATAATKICRVLALLSHPDAQDCVGPAHRLLHGAKARLSPVEVLRVSIASMADLTAALGCAELVEASLTPTIGCRLLRKECSPEAVAAWVAAWDLKPPTRQVDPASSVARPVLHAWHAGTAAGLHSSCISDLESKHFLAKPYMPSQENRVERLCLKLGEEQKPAHFTLGVLPRSADLQATRRESWTSLRKMIRSFQCDWQSSWSTSTSSQAEGSPFSMNPIPALGRESAATATSAFIGPASVWRSVSSAGPMQLSLPPALRKGLLAAEAAYSTLWPNRRVVWDLPSSEAHIEAWLPLWKGVVVLDGISASILLLFQTTSCSMTAPRLSVRQIAARLGIPLPLHRQAATALLKLVSPGQALLTCSLVPGGNAYTGTPTFPPDCVFELNHEFFVPEEVVELRRRYTGRDPAVDEGQVRAWRRSLTKAVITRHLKSVKDVSFKNLHGAISEALQHLFPVSPAETRDCILELQACGMLFSSCDADPLSPDAPPSLMTCFTEMKLAYCPDPLLVQAQATTGPAWSRSAPAPAPPPPEIEALPEPPQQPPLLKSDRSTIADQSLLIPSAMHGLELSLLPPDFGPWTSALRVMEKRNPASTTGLRWMMKQAAILSNTCGILFEEGMLMLAAEGGCVDVAVERFLACPLEQALRCGLPPGRLRRHTLNCVTKGMPPLCAAIGGFPSRDSARAVPCEELAQVLADFRQLPRGAASGQVAVSGAIPLSLNALDCCHSGVWSAEASLEEALSADRGAARSALESIDCPVCLDEVPRSELWQPWCAHVACMNCWHEHVSAELARGSPWLTCMMSGCRACVSLGDLAQILDKSGGSAGGAPAHEHTIAAYATRFLKLALSAKGLPSVPGLGGSTSTLTSLQLHGTINLHQAAMDPLYLLGFTGMFEEAPLSPLWSRVLLSTSALHRLASVLGCIAGGPQKVLQKVSSGAPGSLDSFVHAMAVMCSVSSEAYLGGEIRHPLVDLVMVAPATHSTYCEHAEGAESDPALSDAPHAPALSSARHFIGHLLSAFGGARLAPLNASGPVRLSAKARRAVDESKAGSDNRRRAVSGSQKQRPAPDELHLHAHVLALWHGTWYPALIEEQVGAAWRVAYTTDETVEVLPPSKLKLDPSIPEDGRDFGPEPLLPDGQKVTAIWNRSSEWPGTISSSRLLNHGEWVYTVQFDDGGVEKSLALAHLKVDGVRPVPTRPRGSAAPRTASASREQPWDTSTAPQVWQNVEGGSEGSGLQPCTSCALPRHTPVPCSIMQAWKAAGGFVEESRETAATLRWQLENTKPCPNCGMRVNKNGGCVAMVCTSCQYHFCWGCLGPEHSHAATCTRPVQDSRFRVGGSSNFEACNLTVLKLSKLARAAHSLSIELGQSTLRASMNCGQVLALEQLHACVLLLAAAYRLCQSMHVLDHFSGSMVSVAAMLNFRLEELKAAAKVVESSIPLRLGEPGPLRELLLGPLAGEVAVFIWMDASRAIHRLLHALDAAVRVSLVTVSELLKANASTRSA